MSEPRSAIRNAAIPLKITLMVITNPHKLKYNYQENG